MGRVPAGSKFEEHWRQCEDDPTLAPWKQLFRRRFVSLCYAERMHIAERMRIKLQPLLQTQVTHDMHLKYAAAAASAAAAAAAAAAAHAVNRVRDIEKGPIPQTPASEDVTKVYIGIREGENSYFMYTP